MEGPVKRKAESLRSSTKHYKLAPPTAFSKPLSSKTPIFRRTAVANKILHFRLSTEAFSRTSKACRSKKKGKKMSSFHQILTEENLRVPIESVAANAIMYDCELNLLRVDAASFPENQYGLAVHLIDKPNVFSSVLAFWKETLTKVARSMAGICRALNQAQKSEKTAKGPRASREFQLLVGTTPLVVTKSIGEAMGLSQTSFERVIHMLLALWLT